MSSIERSAMGSKVSFPSAFACLYLLSPTFFICAPLTGAETDRLWLRYEPIQASAQRVRVPVVVSIKGDGKACSSSDERARMRAAADELELALGIMSRQNVSVDCCCGSDKPAEKRYVHLHIDDVLRAELGEEGFKISSESKGVSIMAASGSGGLYGVFRYLSHLQRGKSPSNVFESKPAMTYRAWDLWDGVSGQITRGYAGASLIWPYALYSDDELPPRESVFVTDCNASDPFQRWYGDTFSNPGKASAVRNGGGNASWISTLTTTDPVQTTSKSSSAAVLLYNHTNMTLSIVNPSAGTRAAHGQRGQCIDLNGGRGPDIDFWECHPSSNLDYRHQQFVYSPEKRTLSPFIDASKCLTLDRTTPIPSGNTDMDPWNGRWKRRARDMVRLVKSSGMNTINLLDVNACGENAKTLDSKNIATIAANLRPIFAQYAVVPYISACFGAPTELEAKSSDPRLPEVQHWWKNKAEELQRAWGGIFGGFVVKADSEGNVGPMTFNVSESFGANMLADSVAAQGMSIVWRAFVYGMYHNEDLARQSFDTFHPLDGSFRKNVFLQIKNGPMDFQIREPVHPLFGALKSTQVILEVQAAQEYTGQQIHAVNLVTMWKEYLDFDTRWDPQGLTLGSLLSGGEGTSRANLGRGMACVSNLGNFRNWTGHTLAASNFFGCGRLAWNPLQSANVINEEFVELSFPGSKASTVATITNMLGRSRDVYEGYFSPLGIGFLIAGNGNMNGCAPKTQGNSSYGPGYGPGGRVCPKLVCYGCDQYPVGGRGAQSDHYWINPCSNYDFANYSSVAVGCDRSGSRSGSGYIDLYSPQVQRNLMNLSKIDERLLLFFHNVRWDYVLRSTNKTVFDSIRDGHERAVQDAVAMMKEWEALEGDIDADRWAGVRRRFQQQANDAAIFSKVLISYYTNLTSRSREVEPPNANPPYVVRVTNRMLTGAPLLTNSSDPPFSANACGGFPCTNILNPAWIPFPNRNNKSEGGLFVRLATPGCYPSVIALLPQKPESASSLEFETPSDAHVLRDGPKGTPQESALAADPRAVYRKITGEYFVTYQTGWNSTRRTTISSTKTPSSISSWKRFPQSMFDIDDCGTAIFFPQDDDSSIPLHHKRAFAIATFGTLRGGNLSLVSSDADMLNWTDHGVLLYTRSDKWDNATLSAGPPPVRLSDGSWLILYNVDNLWPVSHPKSLPSYGRCALGYAILDKTLSKVLGRSEVPLVEAALPWELSGTTPKVVYTDGMRDMGNDTFIVFAGGADTVVEAFEIKVDINNNQ